MAQLDRLSPVSFDADDFPGGLGLKLLRRLLAGLRYGRLQFELPSGATFEKIGSEPGPEAVIRIHRWRMLRRVILSGDIGFAEGYINGDWSTPDLTDLIRLGARNTQGLAPAIGGSWPMKIFHRLIHAMNSNTKRGSRRNIEAHYDLGNRFYSQWLDASMLYSSAIWDADTPSLEAAQSHRLAQIRGELALSGNESILEIGCGWGALAKDLANHAGGQVTGITLSPSQLAWAREQTSAEIAAGRVDLRLQDYRDVQGQFDRIVSIEMFEAVGKAYWPAYFAQIRKSLKPGGRAVLQIISIEEERYCTYSAQTDFIQAYIFPGGFLPSVSALQREITDAGLVLTRTRHFGQSYARTLADWRARFEANWLAIAALGFDGEFRHLWNYYLCYCEAGFEEGSIDVGLYTIEHAGH